MIIYYVITLYKAVINKISENELRNDLDFMIHDYIITFEKCIKICIDAWVLNVDLCFCMITFRSLSRIQKF